MKNYIYVIFIIILFACSNKQSEVRSAFKKTRAISSKIDSLKTISEIEQFIYTSDSNYSFFKLKRIIDFPKKDIMYEVGIAIADSLKINKSFYKEDLDNNGYRDLIVTGSTSYNDIFYSFTLLNYSKDSIKIIDTRPMRHTFTIPKIVYVEKQPLVEIYYPDMFDWKTQKIKKIKRLVTVKFGNYIEFNESPKISNIEKIEFSTTGCFGTCPIFEIVLNKDKTAIFKPHRYNLTETENEEKQIFQTKVDSRTFNEIITILNYIDFPKLQNDYSVSWTDDQSSTLKITYNNGKIKTIRDYGLTGTYGLRKLYDFLFRVRKSQNWKNTSANSKLAQTPNL